QVDMLTDDHRAAWADQIVQKQAVDAVSGVTVSSAAVQEAVDATVRRPSAPWSVSLRLLRRKVLSIP
ncbi:MAG: FMN-binding protein, partial [Oscillospiraceae bacterium]|nr:FMN-binding protein [Oscillospiraceae bacterium]